jgi:hypothetical protein
MNGFLRLMTAAAVATSLGGPAFAAGGDDRTGERAATEERPTTACTCASRSNDGEASTNGVPNGWEADEYREFLQRVWTAP